MAYQQRRVPRRRTLPIRGLEYSIVEWGNTESPCFFFLHGWGDAGATFQFVVDALASDWHVIAPDWRGFGFTEKTPSSYWFPDYIADIHSIIEFYSAQAPVRLVGHSMGGNVATLYAGTMPERVAAFVNLEGFGIPDSVPADAPLRYRRWIEESIAGKRYSSYESFDELAKKVAQRNPGISSAQAEFVARQWACRHEDGVIRVNADAKHKLPNPILYRRAEAASCAARISAPTLLISGADSPYRQNASEIAPATPANSESAVIESAGHMLHLEAPAALARLVEDFLSKTL